MTVKPARTRIVNLFGFLGYVSIIFQWCWSGLLVAYPYLQSATTTPPQKASPTAQAIVADPVLSPIVWITSILITIVMLIVCVVLAWRMPRAIGKKGAQLTHEPAKKATTLVLKHQHRRPTKKTRLRLTYRFVLIIKALLVSIPLVALAVTAHPPLAPAIMWTVGLWCFGWSIAFFVVQHYLGKLFDTPTDAIW